jgi:hypothetical protein
MTAGSGEAIAAFAPEARVQWPWMFSKKFDILFYFAPIAIGIFCFALSQYAFANQNKLWLFLAVNAFGAGPFHWGPTWFTYLDRKNRGHYASSWSTKAIFYLGPPAIILFCAFGWLHCKLLIYAFSMIWTIQHVVQQNVGILLLYHNHGQNEAIADKRLEIHSQWAPSILFSLIFIQRIFLSQQPTLLMIPIILCGIWAIYAVFTYLSALKKQCAQGKYLNMPAMLFWLSSILSLVPFAFIGRGFEDAFIIPVAIHWFQYIGLNFMLVKVKYGADESDNRMDLPADKPLTLYFAACVVFLTITLLIAIAASTIKDQLWLAILGGIGVGLGNTHYFLDAFLWRFRGSHQRETILPYLNRPRRQLREAIKLQASDTPS